MTRSRPSRFVALALLLAVWATTTLGLVHGSLHALDGRARATVLAAPAAGATAQGSAPRHAWLHALFADRTDAECRLYDVLSHGAGLPGVPLVLLPVALPAATFACLPVQAIYRWTVHFDARGPPGAR
ncbi:hypothetical protein [Pseudacidovorax sp. NFM-22]|uniref:hypothetical protein n=1 Tax=Pseudacidovorax sp. NFM-22 TaxID=2744469 RepID=UPI001F1B93D8|nr:hypothetical protein [Pseudacidovorax sp. NFM-22]